MPGLVSATGVLAFLADEEPELKVFALQTLNDDIDTVWTEVAGALNQIEALYEDESFPERQLAALVLAKVYYHLQAYNDSMVFALAAGDLFKLDSPGEFEETIISKCVDQYIATTAAKNSKPRASKKTDLPELTTTFSNASDSAVMSPTTPFSHTTLPPKSLLSRTSLDNTILDATFQPVVKQGRSGSIAELPNRDIEDSLQRVIERLFASCLKQGRYRQVVGIAVEARNLEVLRRVIKQASEDEKNARSKSQDGLQGPAEELMEYTLGICMDIVQERSFRTEILQLILDLLNDIPNPDYFAIARCVVYLNSDDEASRMLRTLVSNGDRTSIANAYQIAFDLHDNGTQEFLGRVLASLPAAKPRKEEVEASDETAENKPLLDNQQGDPEEDLPEGEAKAYRNIRSILDGSKTIRLNLEFLYRNNHTDLSILNKVRDSLEGRNSIFHTAVTFCNAFMNQGTTNDKFFRDNLEWLGKAVNWSKFTATAALGVIHRGNLSQSRKLLEPYLPRQGGLSSGSIFSQGGALYAYGLIHANHGADALDYLKAQFSQAEEEVVQHGGALGLGIAGMATGDMEIFDKLKNILFQDSALNGEAVGLAMGLIMLGTGNVKALEVMITYAHETTHEKIVRGVALGMALIMFGRQEGADVLVEGLLNDPDPTLRYGGIMTVALAYCGTGSNKAIRKLLHTAVSDVNDDVRRIAVMSLGFILFRKPGSVPRMVELLSESYNPHVRYGSAMALGISCAGTGLDEAIDLLEPMMKDPTDFVRQGALIALSMIMVQQNDVMNPKVSSIRKTLKKVVGDRHEDAMTKFGAALALGIIDAGGRNCTIGLQTQTGNLNMAGIVGMAVFTQYWYWFPFTHFLSLSFSPTAIIGLDHDLEMPDIKFHCATRQSLFDYPPEQEVKVEEGPAMIATAILSTTAQAKRRAQKKERAQRRESMDLDTAPAKGVEKMDVDEEKKEYSKDKKDTDDKDIASAETKKKPEKEKVGYDIENMSRVLPGQLKYVSFLAGRYKPVKKPTGGPLLLDDTKPEEPKSLIEEKLKKVTTERAPVAGQGRSGAGGRSGRPTTTLLDGLVDPTRAAGSSQVMGQLLRGQGSFLGDPQTPSGNTGIGAGAAAAAGVLTAVDEDGEGDEEAPTPGEFEYFTDGEDNED
ncbi:proteasome/cyclosome and HEAT repeat protein [Metarhizium robertsii]|uniref:26S proteasome regulatory subunit RPN2 n=2 Tax=Metarhizium robertsii TaxID=568076 RepID=E9F3V1_METRA|nr:26S proteasome regulatory complex, non-ATPase subcomplex, Rpn2/Psmd1 subunit [Metarhizium robertsii ARSEF 23]EFY97637.1 26S proteasome regulatory complex, non-ATPase subcomplex, Rpn2/Psmd1 subunit [Metarhizium robertsii ARSEF 23]EXV05134.1 proteasome/cyclosome and HEAT repeat protein [Metarhizium robertsii]